MSSGLCPDSSSRQKRFASFTPLPVATRTGQNRELIERLVEILFTGACIPWDWH